MIECVPGDCKKVELDGSKTICPEDIVYAVEETIVTPSMIPDIATRQSGLSANVTVNGASTVTAVAGVIVGGGGAFMLNVLEETEIKPLALNTIVAPVIGPVLVAVNPEKVTTPLIGAFSVTPPSVHVPTPT